MQHPNRSTSQSKQYCGKRRFRDIEQAKDTLRYAAIARRLSDGPCRRREVRYYFCDRCRGWHVTSRELWEAVA